VIVIDAVFMRVATVLHTAAVSLHIVSQHALQCSKFDKRLESLGMQLRKAETDRDVAIDKQLAAQAAQQRAEELNKKWDEREAKVIDIFNFLDFLVTFALQDVEIL
jgi:predicted Holliday junction resolvase-like endonuclease